VIYFLSVDLASKFSAAILRDETGQVRWQADSAGKTANEWVDTLAAVADRISQNFELHILVEDVPYGVSSQAMTKPATRLQGMLMHAMGTIEFYFINPSTWMKDYEGVARAPKGMTKAESLKYRDAKALEHATRLGYEPPDLIQKYKDSLPEGTKVLKKNTDPLAKSMTDYVMAFLINDWLQRHVDEYKTLTGVQPPLI
jgi:hypothetical protein